MTLTANGTILTLYAMSFASNTSMKVGINSGSKGLLAAYFSALESVNNGS